MAKIEIPDRMIPKGGRLVECYETADEFIIIGYPPDEYPAGFSDEEKHDCDYMGCSSLSHVILRVDKNKFTVTH